MEQQVSQRRELVYDAVLYVWVPESRSWVLSCEFATGVAGAR